MSFYSQGGGGGGGFMLDSPSSNQTPGGGRKPTNTSIRPVTTKRLLNDITQSHGDADFELDGAELGAVGIVAQIRSIKMQTTNTVYYLFDGPSGIEARAWKDVQGDGMDDDEEELLREEGIYQDQFVYVVGTLKQMNNKKHIHVTSIRPVVDTTEILHHHMEVALARLYYTRGPLDSGGGASSHDVDMKNNSSTAYGGGGGSGGPAAYQPSSQYGAGGGGGGGMQRSIADSLHLKPLEAEVLRVLERLGGGSSSREGVHVGEIVRHMNGKFGGHEISDALDSLMDDGHVYSTIDESHFNIST